MTKDLADRVELMEKRIEQAQHQMEAQQHALTWLLSRLPQQEVSDFLDRWKLECVGIPRLDEDVALISALNEDLPLLRGEYASAQGG